MTLLTCVSQPGFKGVGRYHSLTFPKVKQDCLDGKFITLPSFGKVKLIVHRQIPQGFKIKTATIIQKADGWYVILSLEDSSVPVLSPDLPTMDKAISGKQITRCLRLRSASLHPERSRRVKSLPEIA